MRGKHLVSVKEMTYQISLCQITISRLAEFYLLKSEV